LQFTFPKASLQDAQPIGKAFRPQKRTFSTSKHKISLLFSIFVGYFLGLISGKNAQQLINNLQKKFEKCQYLHGTRKPTEIQKQRKAYVADYYHMCILIELIICFSNSIIEVLQRIGSTFEFRMFIRIRIR
jgi:hypothetical protein